MKTNQRAPDPLGRQPIASAAHDTSSRGEIVVMDAQQPDNCSRWRRNRGVSVETAFTYCLYVVARICPGAPKEYHLGNAS
jgi:hypothetical protein